MKKFLSKIGGKKQPQEPAGRITTDTLAEHREKVLAGGRKFKYPVQYQRHKLVINAVIIATASLLVMVGLGWYMLYPAQNTSEFIYRVTKVVPVPVADIDGQKVSYSDYLMKYRGASHFLLNIQQIDAASIDGQRQLQDTKRGELNNAIADAYAAKLAKGLDIKVEDSELEAYLLQQRQAIDGEVSEATYRTVIRDYYDWSFEEYVDVMKSKLLRKEVSYVIDTAAKERSELVASKVGKGETDFKQIVDELNTKSKNSAFYAPPTWVPRTNQDHGLAKAAAKLEKGQVSEAIKTSSLHGEGYYFVKLIDSNDASVSYEYIFIALSEFNARLRAAQEDGKLTTYITIKDIER